MFSQNGLSDWVRSFALQLSFELHWGKCVSFVCIICWCLLQIDSCLRKPCPLHHNNYGHWFPKWWMSCMCNASISTAVCTDIDYITPTTKEAILEAITDRDIPIKAHMTTRHSTTVVIRFKWKIMLLIQTFLSQS